ncbi:MAG: AAA family ATPase [Dehalococcoidia bacterium]
MATFIGYTITTPLVYRASASLTVPQELSMKDQLEGQYVDRQMLLLESQAVAKRALYVANSELGDDVFELSDFSTEHGSLEFSPPEGYTPGAYGSNIIGVTFRWPNASGAQAGANAVLEAFDEVRTASIREHTNVAIAAIERAIAESPDADQRTELLAQRATTLVNQQIDLAQHPTFQRAVEPQDPINRSNAETAALGLFVGVILGTALAYALASRRRIFDDRFTPSAVYGAPLIGEIPAFTGRKKRAGTDAEAAYLLPVTSDPRSAVAEAFRFAAGSIERIRNAHGPQLSIVFAAPTEGSGKSTVVANVALALAEGDRRVLAIDADAIGDLSALLLPGDPVSDCFEQVLAGRRTLAECTRTSSWNDKVTVLPAGEPAAVRVTGAAYSMAVAKLLADATSSFDVVVIDSPALLAAADAAGLVEAADVAVAVVSSRGPVGPHRAMVERLALVDAEFVGYVDERAAVLSSRARLQRESLRTEEPALPPGAVPEQAPSVGDVDAVNGTGNLPSLPQAHR